MSPKIIQFSLVLTFAILYNIMFWGEKVALNLVVFGTLLGTAVLFMNKKAISRTNVKITASGTLLAGLFVLLHASSASRFAFMASFISFLGFVYAPSLRSLPFSLAIALGNIFAGPIWMADSLRQVKVEKLRKFRLGYYMGIAVIPLVIVGLFFILFSAGNPRFGNFFADIGLNLRELMESIFGVLSPERFAFLITGILLVTGMFFYHSFPRLAWKDASARQTLIRRRKPRHPNPRKKMFPMTGLRKEYRIALLAIMLVNLLSLFNNVLDISWIWFGFEMEEGFNLTQFVHEGTYLLILSILVAMGIMFFFFRGNLNFLSTNKWLRYGAYFWIIQNAIMVISVGLRNYYYISHFGLAYKRIGVYFFLALVLFGLVTLFFKIRNQKTFYRVVRVNAWAVYVVMLLLATVNWDGIITRHNLSHVPIERMDVDFLLSMSDKTMPILDQHRDQLKLAGNFTLGSGWERPYKTYTLEEFLDMRIENAAANYQQRSWLSWNFADAAAMSYFKEHTPERIPNLIR